MRRNFPKWRKAFFYGADFRLLRTFGQTLFLVHAEAEIVAVGIGDCEFSVAPGLVDGRGMQRGVWSPRGVQASRAKSRVALIYVIDEYAAH